MVRYSIHNQLKSCKIIHHKPCFHVKTMKFKILLLINVIRAPNSLEQLSCDSFTQGLSRIAHNEWSSGGVDGRCCHPKKVIQGEIFVFKEEANINEHARVVSSLLPRKRTALENPETF